MTKWSERGDARAPCHNNTAQAMLIFSVASLLTMTGLWIVNLIPSYFNAPISEEGINSNTY